MKSPSKDRLLLAAFLLILVVFGAVAVRKFILSQSSETAIPVAPATPEKPMREVLLYFGAQAASQLLPEAREIEDCEIEEDCVRATVQALIDGPVGDLVPILPQAAVLHGVTLRDNTAELNFSGELISAHPGGSISELLTVYGLADSLAVNFPHIRQVFILVDGKSVETLKGHFGLLAPIKADFTYVRPAEESGVGAPGASEGNRK
jgi:spore germination protein GerM